MAPETTAENDRLEDRRPVAALTTASNHPAVIGADLGYLLSQTPGIDLATIRLIPNEDGTVGIAGRIGPAECPSCHTAGHPHTEYCQLVDHASQLPWTELEPPQLTAEMRRGRAENREYPGQPGERP